MYRVDTNRVSKITTCHKKPVFRSCFGKTCFVNIIMWYSFIYPPVPRVCAFLWHCLPVHRARESCGHCSRFPECRAVSHWVGWDRGSADTLVPCHLDPGGRVRNRWPGQMGFCLGNLGLESRVNPWMNWQGSQLCVDTKLKWIIILLTHFQRIIDN